MRILFLSPRQCWPPITGARLREYYLARALGRCASLTHVFFAQPGSDLPGASELSFAEKIVPIPQPRLYTPAKLARALFSRRPLPVINYFSNEMAAAVERLVSEESFDAIHLDSLHMGAYIPIIERKTQAPVVFDWHNIESELMWRYAAELRSPAKKAYASLTAGRLAAYERYALEKGLAHAVCSARERDELLKVRRTARIAVIENGVDTRMFASAAALQGGRTRIVFVGSMNYHANIDGIVDFARSVWPLVRREHPEWRLTVVGSKPAPQVLALREEPGVEVTGTVDDVRPYYREAVAAIVPLHSGGGTRLKILEAMAAGTPVVSTKIGAEGLSITPGSDILIAESPDDWRNQLGILAPQTEVWRRVACAGLELARSRYDWESIGEALVSAYRDWLGR